MAQRKLRGGAVSRFLLWACTALLVLRMRGGGRAGGLPCIPQRVQTAALLGEPLMEHIRLPNFGADLRKEGGLELETNSLNVRMFQSHLPQVASKKMIFGPGKDALYDEKDSDVYNYDDEEAEIANLTKAHQMVDKSKYEFDPLTEEDKRASKTAAASWRQEAKQWRDGRAELPVADDEIRTMRGQKPLPKQEWKTIEFHQDTPATSLQDLWKVVRAGDSEKGSNTSLSDRKLESKGVLDSERRTVDFVKKRDEAMRQFFTGYETGGGREKERIERHLKKADSGVADLPLFLHEKSTGDPNPNREFSTTTDTEDFDASAHNTSKPIKFNIRRQHYSGPTRDVGDPEGEDPKLGSLRDGFRRRNVLADSREYWMDNSAHVDKPVDGSLPFRLFEREKVDKSQWRTKSGLSKKRLMEQIKTTESRLRALETPEHWNSPSGKASIEALKGMLKRLKRQYNDGESSDYEHKVVAAHGKPGENVVAFEFSGKGLNKTKVLEPQEQGNEEDDNADDDSLFRNSRVAKYQKGQRVRYMMRGGTLATITDIHTTKENQHTQYTIRLLGTAFTGSIRTGEDALAPEIITPAERRRRQKEKEEEEKRKERAARIPKPPPGLIKRPPGAPRAEYEDNLEFERLQKAQSAPFIMPRVLAPEEAGLDPPPPPAAGYKYVPPTPPEDQKPRIVIEKPASSPYSQLPHHDPSSSGGIGSSSKMGESTAGALVLEEEGEEEKKEHGDDDRKAKLFRKLRRKFGLCEEKTMDDRRKQNEAIEARLDERIRRPQFKYRLSTKHEWDSIKGPYMPKQK